MHRSSPEQIQRNFDPWIFDARTDLLAIANCYWPLLLLPGVVVADRDGPLDFLQTYFLSSPHRWITLFLVALDSTRRVGNGRRMVLSALLAAAVIGSIQSRFGFLLCLLWIDFVWNAWHFASQHSGVLAIYARKSGSHLPGSLKYLMRCSFASIILMIPLHNELHGIYGTSVKLMICGTILLMTPYFFDDSIRRSRSSVIYFASVWSLYAAILACTLSERYLVANSVFFAASTFHAVEYLAIVSRYVISKESIANNVIPHEAIGFSLNWSTRLTGFLLAFGLVLFQLQTKWPEFSASVNLWAAFLHYAFDGWIWKLRNPATARLVTAVEIVR